MSLDPERYPTPARHHYDRMQRVQIAAVADITRRITQIDLRRLTPSNAVLTQWSRRLQAAKILAAASAVTYLDNLPGLDDAEAIVNPAAFGETTARGAALSTALWPPLEDAMAAVKRGVPPPVALTTAKHSLTTVVRTEIADAGRDATTAGMAARHSPGYVRMLNPPSCPQCIILAGRWYRWNDGFDRHPQCDCVHIPAAESIAGTLTTDPYEAFKALPAAEQDRQFGKGAARAIREGADIYQVVNARRGLDRSGVYTNEGMDHRRRGLGRGHASSVLGPGRRRLSPDAIHQAAKGDQKRYINMLKAHGYLLEQGQFADGVIRGNVEGYGQMGRGGTRKGASAAVKLARKTGVRDPRELATMTAVERRAAAATQALPSQYTIEVRQEESTTHMPVESPFATLKPPLVSAETHQHVTNRHAMSASVRRENTTIYPFDPTIDQLNQFVRDVAGQPTNVTRESNRDLWKFRGDSGGITHEMIYRDGSIDTIYPVNGPGVLVIVGGQRVPLSEGMTWRAW